MYDDDLDEIDLFYGEIIRFIGEETAWKQYKKMSEESQAKWRKKLTIMICYKFAPRRNYDISRNEIAQIVDEACEFYTVIIDE